MQQQRSEETRDQILQAALTTFARTGYEATSVADICSIAGVSKGAFYYHFPTKQSLFLTLFQNWLDQVDEQLRLAQGSAEQVPEALLAMSLQLERIFEQAQGHVSLFLEFWTQANRDPEVWAILIKPYRCYQDWFAGLIEKGVSEGSLRPVEAQFASRLLVATAVGLLLQGLLDPQGADWPAVTRASIDLLLQGFRKESVMSTTTG